MRYCPKCKEELIKSIIDNKERLRCSGVSCGFVFWNNPIPVVAIVVEVDEGIVLAHNKQAPKGIFSMITGFLEADETPEYAAQREVQEELGLDTTAITFLGLFPFARMNQLIIAYHVQAKGVIKLNDELDETIIVQKDELVGWRETGKFEVADWLSKLKVLN